MTTTDPAILRGVTLGSLLSDEAGLSQQILAVRTGTSSEALPADVYLRALALRSAITHALAWGSQHDVREAVEAGATWTQIATARATTPHRARADFRRWVDAQAALWDSGPTESGDRYGLDLLARHAVRALADRRD